MTLLHGQSRGKKGDYRYYYREKLCSQLFDTNWSLYEGMTNNEVLVAINPVEDDDSSTDVEEGNKYWGHIIPVPLCW